MKTEDEVRTLLNNLDLTDVRLRLMKPKWKGGMGWSEKYALSVEPLYRGFLFVSWKDPKKPRIPSRMIDAYWHAHILYTMEYHEMCNAVFGEYLHHIPKEHPNRPISKYNKNYYAINPTSRTTR